MYIGSTSSPSRRFHNYLISGEHSNGKLQAAIDKYDLSNFVAYVLEVVPMPLNVTTLQRDSILQKVEQSHINKYPEAQLYNKIAARVL